MAGSIHAALSVALLTLQSLALYADASSSINVPANYDNERTNANLKETILNPSNVRPDTFGKIGSFPVDARFTRSPCTPGGFRLPAREFETRCSRLQCTIPYAIDADDPASIAPLWQVNLGSPVPSSVLNFTHILPEAGNPEHAGDRSFASDYLRCDGHFG